ncbi:protein phosphatase [Clostridium acidisoli DSM 12555]|uniref:Protein phosphatase n=1 Tax=Clostridium acidisoli DSM 12555 TaxID=1121291 RepID=A0A1W1XCR0_9CLOT|nr:Stp1/IreP family PP2C-type Ser/Thr phosphatase [Clostridium acidisoli]SMC21594.1 protein phosphatase [Clostridium acidisoli DSM 12555]
MVGILSDIGLVRKLNEDSVGLIEDDKKRLYIVADGMGGHNAGEIASKIAVESTIDYVNKEKEFNNPGEILTEAIKFANEKIFEKSEENLAMSGMGTTITACLICNKEMLVANVGDSSCFVVKKDFIEKVTKDHSLVQQLVDAGTITEEEAINHPNKNIITRALGTNNSVEVDIFKLNLEDIKKVVLCSDGLSNSVTKSEIYDIATKNNNKEACEKLIELSKLKGSNDNISVIIFEGKCNDD